ncbi:transcriptional regulator [Dokdonella sp.]|uniref:winged helix-turn-helix domain-containing protein n=1 Tax=Dokdonella sp. TaxID=2291710 RepID=UPI003783543B
MSHPVYHFGDCRVDPLARELHRDGTLLALSPKVFDCLVYLIEHRDRAVGRDELIAAVWGKADVSDTLLGQTLLKARRAVGDDGNEQNAIRTIPRFGYRWVRELTMSSVATDETAATGIGDSATDHAVADAPTSNAEPTSAVAPRRRASRQLGVVLIGAFALLLALGTFIWNRLHGPVETSSVAADALVVLPAHVESSEEWAWLRLGLMDLVASRLRQAGRTVAPSDTVVAAWRTAGNDAGAGTDAAARVGALTGARKIVIPRVSRGAEDWLVELELREGDGTPQRVRSQGHDPIETARGQRSPAVAARRDAAGASRRNVLVVARRTRPARAGSPARRRFHCRARDDRIRTGGAAGSTGDACPPRPDRLSRRSVAGGAQQPRTGAPACLRAG